MGFRRESYRMLTDFAFFRIICSTVVADSLNGPYHENHLSRLWKAASGVFVVQNTCVRSDNESVSYIRLIGLEHVDHLKHLSRGRFGKRLDFFYPCLSHLSIDFTPPSVCTERRGNLSSHE